MGGCSNGSKLRKYGIYRCSIWAGFKDMSLPMKELMKLTLEQKIAHGGNPVLRWNMDNIFIKTDSAENIKADNKEKSTEKIDRAIICGNANTESVYDSRGILFV